MSKLDDALAKYNKEFEKLGVGKVDQALLKAAAKACGPSLYSADASKVGTSDKKEVERIKAGFLAKKLGITGVKADNAIEKVIATLGAKNRNKYRAMFYYLLAKETKKATALKGK